MKKENLYEAIGSISEDYVKSAHKSSVKKGITLKKLGAVAACLALILAIPVALNLIDRENTAGVTLANLSRPYKSVSVSPAEMDVAWKWEYLTVFEKYTSLDIDGVQYIRMGEEIDSSVIGEAVGLYEAVGYNEPYYTPEGGYRETFEAYEIKNVSPECMLALKMEGKYYCFISDGARAELRGLTWGDVMEKYGLKHGISFDRFAKYENGRENGYFSLKDGSYIWEVLSSAGEAAFVNPSEWERDGEYLSFTVTSDVYGIYKKALYVTEDGYLWTNMLEVECIYFIGEDKAEKIISHALGNSAETEWEPYHNTVVGTVAEITDSYILLDDSPMCKDPGDGVTFKILLNDLRINRYVDDGRIKEGELIQIVFKGDIDTRDGYVIDSAISASQCFIADEGVLIPE